MQILLLMYKTGLIFSVPPAEIPQVVFQRVEVCTVIQMQLHPVQT